MTEVILHGILEKKFKKKYLFSNLRCAVDSVQMIECLSKGFKKFIVDQANQGINYEFITDGQKNYNSMDVLSKKQIKKIEIVPHICGSDPVTFFVVLAINLVVAGIVYLMTPIPEVAPQGPSTLEVNHQSFFIINDQNMAQQGTAVPLGYGRLRVGSKIVQAYVEVGTTQVWTQSPAGY